jgi:thiamine biosynthesis lipoprotein
MKETRILMGMPVTVEIVFASPIGLRPRDSDVSSAINKVFDYFTYIDQTFSTFKSDSEITKINQGLLTPEQYSEDMKTVFELSEKTKQETQGYFDIKNNQGIYDPSGLVKGWAIYRAAKILEDLGYENFYVEAGGDIQVRGKNEKKEFWNIGIRNPFLHQEIVKVVHAKHNEGIATSGSYERGAHIYNPKNRQSELAEIVSLTVVGPNIYEADRFATAAFAMQRNGIKFIEHLKGFEAYMIDKDGQATMTSGFQT